MLNRTALCSVPEGFTRHFYRIWTSLLRHHSNLSGAIVARRKKMNKEEFEKAITDVAERLELYLEQQYMRGSKREEEPSAGS